MRIIALLFFLSLLASCGSTAQVDQARPHALPAVADLDRVASSVPYISGGEVVAYGGTLEDDMLSRNGAGLGWAVRRIGPLLNRPGLRYSLVYDPETPLHGVLADGLWAGVADFNSATWRWRDISADPLLDPLYGEVLGLDIAPSVQPLSPAGYVYFALLTLDADVTASSDLIVKWDVDAPFLAPPTLQSPFTWGAPVAGCEIDVWAGDDHQLTDYWDEVKLFRCAGDVYDGGSAVEVALSDFAGNGEATATDTWPEPGGPYTYAAAYYHDNVQTGLLTTLAVPLV